MYVLHLGVHRLEGLHAGGPVSALVQEIAELRGSRFRISSGSSSSSSSRTSSTGTRHQRHQHYHQQQSDVPARRRTR